jgi:1,4-dihydroxy-2-naphthoyl-CoA hydrolase
MDQFPSFQVPFDEADGEGIVFFGNYFRLAHRALENWLPRQGLPWNEWFAHPEIGVPLRHAEADYLKPLRPGQTFAVEIHVAKIGESSVHFEYAFTGKDGEVLTRLKTSHVFIDRKSLKKIAVPERWRRQLTACVKPVAD